MKPPVKHYGLWLEWQRMLLNHEVLEHKVIHHLLSTTVHLSRCLTLRCSDSIFFPARGFSSIWKNRAVFDSSLLSSCLSFWFLFTENEYVGLILSSIYMCPCDVVISAGSGPVGILLFKYFFPFDSSMSLIFFSFRWKFLGFLWLGECLREGAASYAHVYVCLPACCQASSFTHVTRAKGGATLLMALTN